jgi:hypothetical protein
VNSCGLTLCMTLKFIISTCISTISGSNF